MVDGGGRCRAAVERRNEGFDGVALSPVGEVGALFVVGFGGGEVEGVGFAAAAQSDVGPFPVGSTVDDDEGHSLMEANLATGKLVIETPPSA